MDTNTLFINLEKQWRESLPDKAERELTFPKEHRQSIKNRLKEIKQQCSELWHQKRRCKNELYDTKLKASAQFELIFIIKELENLEKEQRQILWLLAPPKESPTYDIAKAKIYPITSLIEFNRAKKAKCCWHTDKNPSLQYYPKNNSVWCFVCSRGGDAIDVAQAVYGLEFKEAVKKLTN